MANFATASDALTAALATVDARLRNIDINEQLELYIELIDRRAKIQAAIGASGGGGVSTVTANAGTNLNTSLLALESGGNLAGINNKLPILGQALAAASTPVVLAVAQITALTPLQPPPTFAASTVCLTTALTESSIALTGAKILAMHSRTNTTFRISTISGNTINTQNFESVLNGNEYYQDGINFTGSFFFSAETLPTPVTVLACATSNNSANVTSANSFSDILIGQAVTGTGIPANTFVIARAANGLSITLGNSTGSTVNATANGSVTLTFSGAVIRISRWT